ncbi:MAG: hypothetical protein A2700_02385 [Candidatus Blackburnbacteria bacterium RIFCSPHIGHO2_01_FULL_44_64]|uniref:Type 4 fimbrial biogenesis protein PilX N-terminal domain-containing protein n=1 Tax=Candidatus Blackburnbacteria bacterium RIFCSPHIGHO2_02_FULL_44_20 TaxID=1797516 RepID=A0A1G1V7E4_9BACT|nr:MAG: hypothetical protein A2700_02385 [Candidatus Blackburnbacteria bacterium RIFCSPHIGHO2_01_FULL_44_64]OGY11335.1 MAG: hypothetical protein A3D26_02410 [Candidatus Blackburnbacteria bacterium RIFCSPHIGHO2_02_FULL_44_20]OGY11438.1 MAG: hypothetical protein A3E16_02135 [Candidatus Blackburnbacteria bacterium RIFCSPHIGHO2_12_FULL_44_25]OGY14361.1 MAG: hypothetical protein A3A62_01705 [Candidatus Blackburnbacteria bacterium RIFCSPLOWO2_01_FULL_44_43]OGY17248.1 MAG: hypothetical protein A3H88_0
MLTFRNSSGQALVVVLLVLSVVLTITLSVVSRSVTDITVSKKEEDALRAVSAAEAGVEQLLKQGAGTTIAGSLSPGSTFNANVTGLGVGTKQFAVPYALRAGDAATLWLVSHATDGTLVCNSGNACFTGNTVKVCWGNSGTLGSLSTAPAIEVSVLHTSSGSDLSTAKIARAVYDPNVSRRTVNNFSSADGTCAVDGKTFSFSKEFALSSLGVASRSSSDSLAGPQQVRLKLFYNTDQDHVLGMSVDYSGNGNFPQQGNKIESLGESGEAKRKVVVYRPYADLPPVFDFSLYSGSGDLVK